MKTIKKFLAVSILGMFGLINLGINMALAANEYENYDDVLNATIDNSLGSAIKGADVVNGEKGAALFNSQVDKLVGYIIDIFIVVGIAVAFFGAYKIMMSDKEDTLKEGIKLVIFGIIGIIIMVSAKFIATSLVGTGGVISSEFGNINDSAKPSGITFASNLYNNIIYPFIKIALYFVIGILFFMMVGKVISFVLSTDDSVKKKAGGVIIWCVVGILIVMGSKQIVEAVMGNQEAVLKTDKVQWISDQGNDILEFGNVPIIAQIINWVMGLTMFIIVVLIIIQGYKIFTKPDDPKTRESMKKAILYIVIGVLVIGAAYIISNVLVVNHVSLDSVSAT